ncbi:glycosyltransferase family 2 protein [Thiohalophilus thiocyanatoxydans]|uniref:Glycosyltransferase involved in cell wall biosynthesis n=1 Tax=Thiohalophilus thiocyanatoxydans TaxID=381308 RepID=A0A4R8IG85_9GAMM|nr:glycosyltransferase family 2 protein [Thiohalophilus thiocyanatoxydans]TDX99571.1 glycosyltransferase involved in cell wall biosynthesis [Thiohalophilus thiocyanatoxydans]
MSITATIITLNEEENIRDCILSVQKVCDEVIVVDSLSQDKTVEIAESTGATVYRQAYLGDGPQKAFAVPGAKNDWILSIDADERLEQDTIEAIQNLDLVNSHYDGYSLKRRNFVGEHWIKAAGFYPDRVVRLYHRERAGYLPRKAHSRVEGENIARLDAHIEHFTYRDYTHWVERINQLSSRDAWAKHQKGVKVTRFTPALHATGALIRKLIFKGGIFQGQDGITVAVTTAFHAYMKYMKLIELKELSSRNKL